MTLWMGNRLLDMDMIILFCLYFYLIGMRQSTILFKNAAGMWQNDKFKPYVAMAADLFLDIVLIQLIGVRGAIISSIFCVGIIELPWEAKVLFRDYFNIPYSNYLKVFFKYGIANVSVVILSWGICSTLFPAISIASLIYRFLICSLVSVLAFYLLYRRTDEIKSWKDVIVRLIKKCDRP